MKIQALFAAVALMIGAQLVNADEMQRFELTIKDHQFHPSEITIPANTRVLLVIHNQDDSPEEFESKALHIEKIIGGGKTATLKIGPLKPGSYPFVGEFHEDTAKGTIIVK